MPFRTDVSARRARRPVVGFLVLVALLTGGTAAQAASSPEGAVQTLVERIESGGFEDLTGVVCPETEDEIRAVFDPTSAEATLGSVDVEIESPTVSLISDEGGTAVVKLTGTMHVSFDEEQLSAFVRAQLEASGQEPTEDAVEAMLGLMTSFAGEDIPVDEDLTVVERDGEWLICDPGSSVGAFTDAGMCGVVTPEEIAAISPVAIESNVGEGDYCQWIGANDTEYLSVDVGLVRGANLDEYRAADPDAQDLTVAGQPAIASYGQLYVMVDAGLLSVLPYLADSPSAEGLDPIVFATSVAELFVPRVGELPVPDDGGDPGAVAFGDGPLADCGVIDLADLSAAGPVQYDTVSGGGGSCVFSSMDPAAGAPYLAINLDPSSTIDDVRTVFGDGTERDVDGHRAYEAFDTVWVELDSGLLSVAAYVAGSPTAQDIDVYDYAADVARHVIGVTEPGS